jgi:hypothetical protein
VEADAVEVDVEVDVEDVDWVAMLLLVCFEPWAFEELLWFEFKDTVIEEEAGLVAA